MNRRLLSCTISIFLSAISTIDAAAQSPGLRAVEYEREFFASDNAYDANSALLSKAGCYMEMGRFKDAFNTLERVEMYAVDPGRRQEVLIEKARAAYLASDYDASIAALSEAGIKLPPIESRQLNPTVAMLLTFAVPAGYVYVGEPVEGVASTLLNAASIAWTVSSLSAGLYVSGILGGAIMLNATYLGAQQRTAVVLDKKNAAAHREAQRSVLEKYF